MCIAHLGHLHHTLNQQQLNEIGRIDVVFVPVDGSMTLDLDGMMEVLTALKAPLMIPMHFFSTFTLHRFLDRAAAELDRGDERDTFHDNIEDGLARSADGYGSAGTLALSV